MYVVSIPVAAEITLNSRDRLGAETLTVRSSRALTDGARGRSRGYHCKFRRPSGSGEEERERGKRRGERRDEARPSRSSGTGRANDAEAMLVKFLALLLLFAGIPAPRA